MDNKDKVYFITNGENIKIGYTRGSLENRLKQLNTGSDEQLYLLGFIYGDKSTEKDLHIKFQKFRIRNNGEWFSPDDSLIDYINQVNLKENSIVIKNEYMNNRVMSCLCV